jgi:hypothetical protein
MIGRSVPVVALMALACVPPPPEQLAPVAVRSTRSKPEIVRIATRELTSAGFEISASDSSAGSITAKRTRDKRGNFDYITCKFAESSLAETNLVSTLTVTVAASGSGDASDVQIRGAVLATYPGLEDSPLPRSESQSDCASTGAIEKKIAAAVAAGVP